MRYQFLAQTKKDFGFLEALGYRIKSEYEGAYSSFKDGFDISYASKDLTARIAYYDMELEIVFQKGKILAPYLFLGDLCTSQMSIFPFSINNLHIHILLKFNTI